MEIASIQDEIEERLEKHTDKRDMSCYNPASLIASACA